MWTWNQDAGTWSIEHKLVNPFNSMQELNTWYASSMTKTLELFSDFTRAWRVSFGNISTSQDAPDLVALEWKNNESNELFLDNALTAIREYSAPIYDLSIEIDEFVYVRVQESLKIPVQSWIRKRFSEFTISAEIDDIRASLWFSICHTLYGPADKDYSPITGPYPEPDEDFKFDLDNNELQLLNQPLLDKALRKWEEYFGSDIEAEGIPGIQKYGFLVEPY
jgi:hypothetical protein